MNVPEILGVEVMTPDGRGSVLSLHHGMVVVALNKIEFGQVMKGSQRTDYKGSMHYAYEYQDVEVIKGQYFFNDNPAPYTEYCAEELETVNKKCLCSKCGTPFGTRWEWSANRFKMDIDIDGQSTKALFGNDANKIGFNHPAIQEGSGYQKLILASRHDLPYRLCPTCHARLVGLIGGFIKT